MSSLHTYISPHVLIDQSTSVLVCQLTDCISGTDAGVKERYIPSTGKSSNSSSSSNAAAGLVSLGGVVDEVSLLFEGAVAAADILRLWGFVKRVLWF